MSFEAKKSERRDFEGTERVICPICGSLLFRILASNGKIIEHHKCRKCKQLIEVRIY